MKIFNFGRLARAALAAGVLAAVMPSASAVLTTYSPGDLFIGFRQTSASQTLVANIGSAAQFLPASLGGTATGSFIVDFGVVPNTSNIVTNLAADLADVFGEEWAENPTDGSGVRWAVGGITNFALDDTPINGLDHNSVFLTKARTNPAVQSTTIASGDRDTFSAQFNAFVNSTGASSYNHRESTENSSVAYIGAASGADNWNTRLGSLGFGYGRNIEQALNGNFSGPTNSVLDLYLVPNPESSLTTARTYLGSFSLDALGQLTFTAVPEPSTFVLLGLAATGYVVFRRRRRSKELMR